ncbi:MAG: 30S ribosomal protein S8 [Clostridia bacterium]|nr:30S ribosomal protein S8 [Clostridia bacterium]
MIFDPIADMLTRIRNALSVKHPTVEVPYSNIKNKIAEILKNEGYIEEVAVEGEGVEKKLVIKLKYYQGKPVIQGIQRISKPSLRIFATVENMPKVINGLGIAILTTTKGVMTDKEARKQRVGGEVIAYVW